MGKTKNKIYLDLDDLVKLYGIDKKRIQNKLRARRKKKAARRKKKDDRGLFIPQEKSNKPLQGNVSTNPLFGLGNKADTQKLNDGLLQAKLELLQNSKPSTQSETPNPTKRDWNERNEAIAYHVANAIDQNKVKSRMSTAGNLVTGLVQTETKPKPKRRKAFDISEPHVTFTEPSPIKPQEEGLKTPYTPESERFMQMGGGELPFTPESERFMQMNEEQSNVHSTLTAAAPQTPQSKEYSHSELIDTLSTDSSESLPDEDYQAPKGLRTVPKVQRTRRTAPITEEEYQELPAFQTKKKVVENTETKREPKSHKAIEEFDDSNITQSPQSEKSKSPKTPLLPPPPPPPKRGRGRPPKNKS